MKRLSLSLMFSLAMCVSMFAGEIYVFHDSTCMDKLQFKEKTLTADYKLKTTGNLISYNVHANANELVRLDVSQENEEILSDMPIGTKNCHELIWDEQFSKDINAQVTEIYIVTLVDGKYRVSPVESASYFFSSDDEISYSDEAFGFTFDLGEFDPSADLLTYGLKSKVKFSFADDLHCPGEYHFYKSTKGRNLSENEVVVVPNIGIIRNYTISKKLNRNLRELDLQMVNDMPLSMFMEQSCNKVTEAEMMKSEPALTKRTPSTADMSMVENADANQAADIVKSTTSVPNIATTNVPATQKVMTNEGGRTLPVASLPGSNASNTVQETCHHIYRNADTGFFYNWDTGKTANGECGGITYVDGVMQNSDYQQTTSTTAHVSNAPIDEEFVSKGGEVVTTEIISEEITNGQTEVTETIIVKTKIDETPTQKVIVTETTPKIVYKEPKVIYKEANPIVIDETLEPQDTKIISRPARVTNNNNNTANFDCTVAPRTGFHVVKKGETLYRLSNTYSASIEDLMKWNGLSNSAISVCQLLRVQPEVSLTQNAAQVPANEFVSKGSTVNTMTTVVTKSAPVKRVYHYITQGETLYAISKQYGVNVEDVKKLNKLSDNYLKPGWRLLIPNSSDELNAAQPVQKTVAPMIKETSEMDMTPKAGSSMKIPESSEAHLNNYQNQHIYHTVAEDETINDIAMKYGTSINALKLLNSMGEGEVLIPFQKIKVR